MLTTIFIVSLTIILLILPSLFVVPFLIALITAIVTLAGACAVIVLLGGLRA